jgi:hypothetical protein
MRGIGNECLRANIISIRRGCEALVCGSLLLPSSSRACRENLHRENNPLSVHDVQGQVVKAMLEAGVVAEVG